MSFGKSARFDTGKPRVTASAKKSSNLHVAKSPQESLKIKLAELEALKNENRLLKERQVRCRSCAKEREKVDKWMMVLKCGHLYCQKCAAETGRVRRNCGRGKCNVLTTTELKKVYLPEVI